MIQAFKLAHQLCKAGDSYDLSKGRREFDNVNIGASRILGSSSIVNSYNVGHLENVNLLALDSIRRMSFGESSEDTNRYLYNDWMGNQLRIRLNLKNKVIAHNFELFLFSEAPAILMAGKRLIQFLLSFNTTTINFMQLKQFGIELIPGQDYELESSVIELLKIAK